MGLVKGFIGEQFTAMDEMMDLMDGVRYRVYGN